MAAATRSFRCLLLTALALGVSGLAAQEPEQQQGQRQEQEQPQDLTLPPRLDDAPGEARLAAQPEDRRDALEEVVVVAESEWRLPDLGSAWRARQEDVKSNERIEVKFLPLYDPEQDRPTYDPFFTSRELQQVGFVELFRLRFGDRSR